MSAKNVFELTQTPMEKEKDIRRRIIRLERQIIRLEHELKEAESLLQGTLGWAWSGTEGFGIHNRLAMEMKAKVKAFLDRKKS